MAENEIIEAGVNENTDIAIRSFDAVVASVINDAQFQILKGRTDKKFIRTRPGKGNQTFSYVPVGYVIAKLNQIFGWSWSWEILPQGNGDLVSYFPAVDGMRKGSFIVTGRLTVEIHNPENPSEVITTIVKEAIGEKEEMKGMTTGGHMKSAASDALKKAATLVGVALDLYWQDADEDYLEEEAKSKKGDVELMRLNGMEDADIARELDEDGMGRSAIAKALDVSISDVIKWCKKNGD